MGIGIFGGTFDPVHIGHLRAAEEVREVFALDRIYFIPGHIPPHKRDIRVSSAEERVAMLRMAVRGNLNLRVSDTEIRRGGVSYSIDTVKTYEKRYGDIYFLVGMDAFAEIETWRQYEQIFNHTNIVVMVRPEPGRPSRGVSFPERVRGSVTEIDGTTFEHISGKRIYLYRVTQMDVSSTRIRETAKKGLSVKYLIPAPVERYIKTRGMYKN